MASNLENVSEPKQEHVSVINPTMHTNIADDNTISFDEHTRVNNVVRMERGMHHSNSIVAVTDFDIHQQAEVTKDYVDQVPYFLQNCEDDVVNVTSATAGARILFATDEWFAAADNLLKDTPPHFDPNEYCEEGKVMDGWETRRRREAGHDWCVIRLAARLHHVVGIEIDTAYFTGNNAPAISLELADITSSQTETDMVTGFPNALQRLLHGCVQGTGHSPEQVEQAEKACRNKLIVWNELLPKTPLNPGYHGTRMHYFTVSNENICGTHLRVNYFPDGGVARLRLWGYANNDMPRPIPCPAYSPISTGAQCTVVGHSSGLSSLPSAEQYNYPELSSQEFGGIGLLCSNRHYGVPHNLIQSGYGLDMGDGWETARHTNRPHILSKNPKTGLVDSSLSDWCIIKLGSVAADGIARIILDTKHLRGNYPESVQVEGCLCYHDDALLSADNENEGDQIVEWFPLIDRVRMAPDSEHCFDRTKNQILNPSKRVSHIRVSIFPDGGLSRVRVYGTPTQMNESNE